MCQQKINDGYTPLDSNTPSILFHAADWVVEQSIKAAAPALNLVKDTHGSNSRGWIGVDLDGTLAEYHGWKGIGHIGKPIPRMVERVKQWLAEGKQVRILTARVAPGRDNELARAHIHNWCKEVFGRTFVLTHEKDRSMIELWDDRVVQVLPNSGVTIAEQALAAKSQLFDLMAQNEALAEKLAHAEHCAKNTLGAVKELALTYIRADLHSVFEADLVATTRRIK